MRWRIDAKEEVKQKLRTIRSRNIKIELEIGWGRGSSKRERSYYSISLVFSLLKLRPSRTICQFHILDPIRKSQQMCNWLINVLTSSKMNY